MTPALWLTSREAAAYVGSKSLNGWYEWRKRHGIVKRANGTVNRADLDRALRVRRPRPTGGTTRNARSLANLERSPRRSPVATPQEG